MTPLRKKKRKSGKSDTARKGTEKTGPVHVAMIMDGNGRWAEAKGLPRAEGHKAGSENVRRITEAAMERGVRYLTLFAFSSENWKRPKTEVSLLMGLVRKYLDEEQKKLMDENIRLRVIGSRAGLASDIVRKIAEVEKKTEKNTKLDLVIALNYGGRQEIANAAKKMAEAVKQGKLTPEKISEQTVGGYLYTAGMPDVDLIIRTSGEQRISGFLLWQAAYAELLFVKKHWPDFKKADFKRALDVFGRRSRRFGGLNETRNQNKERKIK